MPNEADIVQAEFCEGFGILHCWINWFKPRPVVDYTAIIVTPQQSTQQAQIKHAEDEKELI